MPTYDTLDRLYSLAERQDGYFTMQAAAHEGIAPTAVVAAERRGRVERISRGVYRLKNYPYGQNTTYWEAVLWPQVRTDRTAVLSYETALRLHGLSDVNPNRTHITVPKRARIQRESKALLEIHHEDLTASDIDRVDGLPVTSIERTFQDIAKQGGHNPVLHDAVRDARARGIIINNNLLLRIGMQQ